MNKLILGVLFLTIGLISADTAANRQLLANCEVGPRAADQCLKVMMFEGDRDRFVPRNDKDMDKHCRIVSDSVKCLEKHSKCYRSLSRQLFSIGVRQMKKTQRLRCKTPAGRQEFLKHMGCIQSETTSEPIHKCVDKWTWMMNYILKNVTQENHFGSSCCAFHLFEKCLLEEATALCEKRTGPSTAIYIRDIMKDAVSDFMDLACSRARTVDQCKMILPDLTMMFELKLEEGVPRQNSSALFPFLQMLQARHNTNDRN